MALSLAPAGAQNPAITESPLPLSLSGGQVAVFKVAATDALSYRWRKDDADLAATDRISGVSGPVLSISPALPGDAGSYSVVVSNAAGSTPSAPAALSINLTLPGFTLAPLSQTIAAGAAVGFSAAASGTGPVTYQWVRYGIPLANDGRITGATTDHLNIATLTSADSGWYWLKATNAAGTVACNPARLTVLTPGDLGVAANFPEGAWTTGGAGVWQAQTDITRDGNALRTSPIPFSSSIYLETTVYGPGELSYFWTVSSEAGYDPLVCQMDGVEQARISGEQVGSWAEQKTAVAWGPHVIRWTFNVDYSIPGTYNAGFLDQVAFNPSPIVSLEEAAAAMPLPLRTFGDAAWFGQTATQHDGISAARSGYISHNQSSTLETSVSGPGTVAFAWKVSSEVFDPVIFLMDGVPVDQIAGEVDWTSRSFRIPWGRHTLGWRYQKDYSISTGSDAAWLDEVTYTPVTMSSLTTAAGGLSPWTAEGTLPFFGQDEFSFDGAAAMQSGPITHNQSSSSRSGVTGPGTLTFRWKVSSEVFDSLRFSIDGSEQARIAGEADWTQKIFVIRPGAHAFDWSYVKDYNVSQGYDAGWVDAVSFAPAPTLPAALNTPTWTWTTTGASAWFPEMVTTHDGAASAHSGDIGDNQSTTMETTITGPGTLTYWWKVSSEYSDPLICFMDGVEQASISGETDWEKRAVALGNGPHTLSWRYQKDYSIARGADAAWVDQVSFNPGPTYASWAAAHFSTAELEDPAISGPPADAEDHDSVTNLLEYALVLEPKTADAGFLPTGGQEGGYLTLTYRQNKNATDVTFTPQVSPANDSGPWSSSGLTETARVDQGSHWLVTVRHDIPIAISPRRFMRLLVTTP